MWAPKKLSEVADLSTFIFLHLDCGQIIIDKDIVPDALRCFCDGCQAEIEVAIKEIEQIKKK